MSRQLIPPTDRSRKEKVPCSVRHNLEATWAAWRVPTDRRHLRSSMNIVRKSTESNFRRCQMYASYTMASSLCEEYFLRFRRKSNRFAAFFVTLKTCSNYSNLSLTVIPSIFRIDVSLSPWTTEDKNQLPCRPVYRKIDRFASYSHWTQLYSVSISVQFDYKV